jgi:hypothetical protein
MASGAEQLDVIRLFVFGNFPNEASICFRSAFPTQQYLQETLMGAIRSRCSKTARFIASTT